MTTMSKQRRAACSFSIESLIGSCAQQTGAPEQHQHQQQQQLAGALEAKQQSLAMRSLDDKRHFGHKLIARQAHPSPLNATAKPKSRPKNFPCHSCPMAFSNNGQLRNHLRIHTGERPFRCNVEQCGKSFTRNEELTRHKLIHSGVRPHTCTSCGKRFGRKDHLKKHARTHSAKRAARRAAHNARPLHLGAALERPTLGIIDAAAQKSSALHHHQSNNIAQFVELPQQSSQPLQPATPQRSPPMTSLNDAGPYANFHSLASDYWSNWYANLISYQQLQLAAAAAAAATAAHTLRPPP